MHTLRRVITGVLALVCLAACGEAYRYFKSGPVGWALKRELRDLHAQRVVLSQLTSFAWDEVFLFGPYFPKADVCSVLAIPVSQCEGSVAVESADDGEMTLAFRKSGALVHTELHYRWHGDFTPTPMSQPIARSKANFRVLPEGRGASGGVWLKLVLE